MKYSKYSLLQKLLITRQIEIVKHVKTGRRTVFVHDKLYKASKIAYAHFNRQKVCNEPYTIHGGILKILLMGMEIYFGWIIHRKIFQFSYPLCLQREYVLNGLNVQWDGTNFEQL